MYPLLEFVGNPNSFPGTTGIGTNLVLVFRYFCTPPDLLCAVLVIPSLSSAIGSGSRLHEKVLTLVALLIV